MSDAVLCVARDHDPTRHLMTVPRGPSRCIVQCSRAKLGKATCCEVTPPRCTVRARAAHAPSATLRMLRHDRKHLLGVYHGNRNLTRMAGNEDLPRARAGVCVLSGKTR